MTGKPVFAHGKTVVGEEVPHQMLQSAIVAPLIKSGEIIGTLKLYGDKKHPLNTLDDKLKQIESYLTIEHARFGDRIQFEMEIVPEAKEWPLPPL
ncbi:MAG: hypothetical protein PVG41_09320, partial [Desulfobacteraceae bacterium]